MAVRGGAATGRVCRAAHTRQLLAIDDGQQSPHAAAGGLDHLDVFAEIRSIVDKPLQAALEARQSIDDVGLQGFDRKQRDEADHGAQPHLDVIAVAEMQDIVEKAIVFIP